MLAEILPLCPGRTTPGFVSSPITGSKEQEEDQGSLPVGATLLESNLIFVTPLITTGCFFFFFVIPTPGRIFDRKHNRESDTVNTVRAEMMGRSRDDVVKAWGPPAAVLEGEYGGKLMVYLPPGRAAESDSPQMSRTFFLDLRGFVYRWAWRGCEGCDECSGDSAVPSGVAEDNAVVRLKNGAAAMGGNVVLMTVAATNTSGSSQRGEAYACPERETSPTP